MSELLKRIYANRECWPGGRSIEETDEEAIKKIVAEAVAAEREAIAAIANEHAERCTARYCFVGEPDNSCGANIAAAIRARGE